jgi:hypothetical protein
VRRLGGLEGGDDHGRKRQTMATTKKTRNVKKTRKTTKTTKM